MILMIDRLQTHTNLVSSTMGFQLGSLIPNSVKIGWRRTPLLHHQLNFNPNIKGLASPRQSPIPSVLSPICLLQSCASSLTLPKKDIQEEYATRWMDVAQRLEGTQRSRSLQELEIIDLLQRLGIHYLFRVQISEALHRHYSAAPQLLQHSSLRYRLLREAGYNLTSTEVFEDYINKEGKLDEDRLDNDLLGLLSLYEACHISLEGEKIFDDGKAITERLLYASIDSLDESSRRLVHTTLKHPHHVTLARFEAEVLVGEFKNAHDWRKEIVDLAMMEYDGARRTYKNEVIHVTKWWKELGLTKELKLARDEPLQWHMWSLAALPDPVYSKERIEMSKPTSLIYIIDDIFDIYGAPEELSLFTESVNRWDLAVAEKLPSYMKKCLKAVFDVTTHISYHVLAKYGWNPENHLKGVWIELFNAYLVESKWFVSGYLPTTEEYTKIGTITCGVHLWLVHMMFLLGQGFNYENDVNNGVGDNHIYTSIMSSVATILRLGNDLGRAKDEDQVGHDGSYIKCYMKENEGASLKDAKEHILGRISNEWKCINGLCLELPQPNPHSTSYDNTTFKEGCLNLARMVPLMYDYDKNRCLEKFIHSLLD